MSVAEVNFTFDRMHCLRDFGCIFIQNGTNRIVSPVSNRSSYAISGMSGTILIDNTVTHDPYTISGTLVPMKSPTTLQAAQQLTRQVAAWLKSGRKPLIWDYEPQQLHYAEVNSAIEFETRTWMDGGIAVTFLVQPYTYDMAASIARQNVTAGHCDVPVSVSTGIPCPVCAAIRNTGKSAIQRVMLATESGHCIELSKGMALPVGGTLRIQMEPPIGATIETASGSVNALRYAVRFDPLTVRGPEAIHLEIDGTAAVELSARGRVL